MCGIAGWLAGPQAPPAKPGALQAMVRALHHRGPDGQGLWLDGPVALGHTRLSIIDLAGGAQPLANEDGRIQVSFNGEIFNYIELRERLVQRGHAFRTRSDTEVLVHLYEDLGDDFVHELNGQFALALWDGRRRRLLLARDRVGIRPLYYTVAAGRLMFASEVKALFALPEVERGFDAQGLAGTFTCWAPLAPRTVWRGVHCLPPGHLLTLQADAAPSGYHLRRYWDWPFQAREAGASAHPGWSDERWADELRTLLLDAVRLQLRADVPVGAYLSGGLDSSIITTLVHRHTTTPLRSFSLRFADAEFDESDAQRTLVRHLGSPHSEVKVDQADIAAGFARLVRHAEMPLVRTAPVPMMLLADHVRTRGCKVVLTGEGADEVFAGYDLFKEAAVRRFVARAPQSPWRGRLLSRLYPYLAHSPAAASAMAQGFFGTGLDAAGQPHFAHMLRAATTRRILPLFSPAWRAQWPPHEPAALLGAIVPAGFAGWPALDRDQYVEAHTLMSGYLLAAQGDRAAMAASVEARFPFLDHRVIEFGCGMPARLRLCGLHDKVLLRRAFAAELPADIARRHKQPFRSPDAACFFDGARLREPAAALLDPGALAEAGLFDPGAVARLVAKCARGRAIGFGDNMAFVGVLSTMSLHAQFVGQGAPATLAT
ncbi:MAG: asparagine synthase (glutamine-hydrolyzing) [Rubrivivax sp.]|nr:asparagine synthase (glutamine-hydrolyzing) [Rubrivivax sp.]